MEERRIAREEKEARELELQHMMKVNIVLHYNCQFFVVGAIVRALLEDHKKVTATKHSFKTEVKTSLD